MNKLADTLTDMACGHFGWYGNGDRTKTKAAFKQKIMAVLRKDARARSRAFNKRMIKISAIMDKNS